MANIHKPFKDEKRNFVSINLAYPSPVQANFWGLNSIQFSSKVFFLLLILKSKDMVVKFSSVQFKMIYLYSDHQTHEAFIIDESGEST